MFEENTKQINRVIANLLAACSAAVLLITLLSVMGMFEFGTAYTLVTLIVGLFVSVAPKLLIGRLPENVMKVYMMATGAIYIGVIGTNAHIGIYITYALMPIFSCLYFDPPFVLKTCAFSYVTMLLSLFVRSKTMVAFFIRADRAGILHRVIAADGAVFHRFAALPDGTGQLVHLIFRQGDDVIRQPLRGFCADAGQAGKLLRHPRDGFNLPGHD